MRISDWSSDVCSSDLERQRCERKAMSTILYSHPACIEHRPGTQHPERPERLKAILAALEEDEFQGLDRREAPRASIDQIALVHEIGRASCRERVCQYV